MGQPHVGFSSITKDSDGSVLVPYRPKSDFGTSQRRVRREKTLDGGVLIDDAGWTDLDRDITVVMRWADDAWTVLQHLHECKTLIHVALEIGYFTGTIRRLRARDGEIRMAVWLAEKLST
jgi:hypothetical protein